jgi:outer membrane usher protein FimD/PapC
VVFRAIEVRPVLGTVVLVDGGQTVIPSFGEIRLATPAGDQVSPLGHGGEFYFENVPPGEHRAVIEYRGVTCAVTLVMPASTGGFVRLGALRCAVPREPRP